MPHDHRMNPLNGNYRPTPRLAQVVASHWSDFSSDSVENAQSNIDYYRSIRNNPSRSITAAYHGDAIDRAFKARHNSTLEERKKHHDLGMLLQDRERLNSGIKPPHHGRQGSAY